MPSHILQFLNLKEKNTDDHKGKAFCCLSSDSPEFLHAALNSFRKCCSNVLSTALCASFGVKNGNLAHNHRFSLQTKCKTANKPLEHHLPKEFKATCKIFDESEIKQQKVI